MVKAPATAMMLQHRYGYAAVGDDLRLVSDVPASMYSGDVGDQVATEMFGAVDQECGVGRGLPPCRWRMKAGLPCLQRGPGATAPRYGSLPTQGSGTMQLQPAIAAGIDTGTVQLVPLHPDPALTGSAEEGIEMGFAEFMKEFAGGGRT